MLQTQNNENSILLKLKKLLKDPISLNLLFCPMLLGNHTFSKAGLKRLIYNSTFKYIVHPFTRTKYYVRTIKDVPKNEMIDSLLLLYSYCKKKNLKDPKVKELMCYFIELLLIEQRQLILQSKYNLIKSEFLLDSSKKSGDILFQHIVELLDLTEHVKQILSENNIPELIKRYNQPEESDLSQILLLSVKLNNKHLAELILSTRPKLDLNVIDQKGKTVLFWACYHNSLGIAKKLITLGAKIFSKNLKHCFDPRSITKVYKAMLNLNADPLVNDYIKSQSRSDNPEILFNYNYSHIGKKFKTNKIYDYNQTSCDWNIIIYKKGKLLKF